MSFGLTCRRIATDNGREREIPESFERRFRRLLACDSAEDVAGQLKAWIRFADAKGHRRELRTTVLGSWMAGTGARTTSSCSWARGFWPVRRESGEEPAVEEAAA